MKIVSIVGLSILLVLIGAQIYSFLREQHDLGQTLSDTENRLQKAQADGASLSADVEYLANPANLEKELREQFNYKKPGETMVIIVPGASSSAN